MVTHYPLYHIAFIQKLGALRLLNCIPIYANPQCAANLGNTRHIINSALLPMFAIDLATLKASQHLVTKINRNAGFACGCNHSATFGIRHSIISFHKTSSQLMMPTLPKLNAHYQRAVFSKPQPHALVNKTLSLKNAARQQQRHLHV